MSRNHFAVVALACLSIVSAQSADARQFSRSASINIGIVMDGPTERSEEIRKAFEKEILALTRDDFKVRFPKKKRLMANWTPAGIKAAVNKLLADPQVHMVIAIGVFSSNEVGHRRKLSKPVVAPFVVDRKLQGLPYKNGKSGVRNLTYVAYPSDLVRDIKVFHDVVSFERLTCVIDEVAIQAIPGIENSCRQAAEGIGVGADYIAMKKPSAKDILAALPDGTDAVYLAPLMRLPSKEFERLVAGLIERRLPSFAFLGRRDVQRGVLAGVAPDVDLDRIVRRTALNIQRILLGEGAGSLKVGLDARESLAINMATARAIGFSPKWTTLNTAELLYAEERGAANELSLARVVRDAVKVNLDVRAADRNVAAGAEDIRQARAGLLPQLDLSGDYVEINEERVFAPGAAERKSSGSVTLNQRIYSESAWANLSIQKHLQQSRESSRDQVRLDVILDTATAYIDVLRAKTVERIQRENLALTRSNLDLARIRRKVGTAGPSEVYRWESEIAGVRINVIDAEALRQQTELALNRLRHRPLEEAFTTTETGVDDPGLITSQKRLFDMTNNPASFAIFRDFLVQEGLAASPERAQLLATVAAQDRSLKSARRAYWQPELGLQADVTEVLTRAGEKIPPRNGEDTETTVGVQLSIPLFTSGSRGADKVRAFESLQQLRLQLRSTEERVEQRIRSALHASRSSYAGIGLSRAGANAARKNLKVVKDAYSRGTASILDLLDAQNAAIVAEQAAANAVHDFLKDLMEVERAISRFDFFLTEQEQAAWLKRMDVYFQQRGGKPGRR